MDKIILESMDYTCDPIECERDETTYTLTDETNYQRIELEWSQAQRLAEWVIEREGGAVTFPETKDRTNANKARE